MSARPTIEDLTRRMRASATRPRNVDPTNHVIEESDAIRIAREYAAERTEPLVALLAKADDFGVFECNEGMNAFDEWVDRIKAALAAEAEARQ